MAEEYGAALHYQRKNMIQTHKPFVPFVPIEKTICPPVFLYISACYQNGGQINTYFDVAPRETKLSCNMDIAFVLSPLSPGFTILTMKQPTLN